MDQDQICCYSDAGLKVFSKDMKNYRRYKETRFSTTLLKVIDIKYPKNPECNIIYDPYNLAFYTFGWPQEGHYFPASVLVSKDQKNTHNSNKHLCLRPEKTDKTSLSDLPLFTLSYLSSLDKSRMK